MGTTPTDADQWVFCSLGEAVLEFLIIVAACFSKFIYDLPETQQNTQNLPLEGSLLHMLGELILPLLQQVGGHDNEGGLDGHRLPLVMVVLVQIHHWPGSRSWVGQNQHQTL